jgi:hypothetical protein
MPLLSIDRIRTIYIQFLCIATIKADVTVSSGEYLEYPSAPMLCNIYFECIPLLLRPDSQLLLPVSSAASKRRVSKIERACGELDGLGHSQERQVPKLKRVNLLAVLAPC